MLTTTRQLLTEPKYSCGMSRTITFTAVRAANVPQSDRRSDTDPFIRWSAESDSAETHYLSNVLGRKGRTPDGSASAEWDGDNSMDVPALGTTWIDVSLYDYEGQYQSSEFMGGASLEIGPSEDGNAAAQRR